jgi:hypothetical protein
MTVVRRTTTAGLLALSLATAGVPAASASPVGATYPTSERPANPAVYSRPDKSIIPSGGDFTAASTPRPVVRIEMAKSGFDWGDAGIGAAGGFVLSLIGLGVVVGATQHRTRRSRGSAVLSGR